MDALAMPPAGKTMRVEHIVSYSKDRLKQIYKKRWDVTIALSVILSLAKNINLSYLFTQNLFE